MLDGILWALAEDLLARGQLGLEADLIHNPRLFLPGHGPQSGSDSFVVVCLSMIFLVLNCLETLPKFLKFSKGFDLMTKGESIRSVVIY